MPEMDLGTEQLIKRTAYRVFFVEGKLQATTQDIADAAGINRPSLHYYFRSKNELIRQVREEAVAVVAAKAHAIFVSSAPFRTKVENFLTVFSEYISEAPYLQTFLINEINCSDKSGKSDKISFTPPEVRVFLGEIEEEMKKGTIKKSSPENFLINLFALVSHPIIMKPLFLDFFELNEEDYERLLNERKSMILNMLFGS